MGRRKGPDRDWPGFLASGPTAHEAKEALKLIDTGVALSPQDGVVGQASKLGGEALAETLSVLFAVAMRRGRVPAAWFNRFIKWLFEGKGDVLDPRAYRGTVFTSLVGKTFERALLQRMLRWLRAKDPLPSLQAVPAGSTTSHLALLNEILALRAARGYLLTS